MDRQTSTIVCEKCGSDTLVLETRSLGGVKARRRRECVECGNRQSTYEVPVWAFNLMLAQSRAWRDVAAQVVIVGAELDDMDMREDDDDPEIAAGV